MSQLGLPLLAPVDAQPARHDHANQYDQPEPETKARCSNSPCHQKNHSCRSATNGSTFVARCAGIQHANNATVISSNTTPRNVSGSVALTLKSSFVIRRVRPYALANPMAIPSTVNFRPCLTTNHTTSMC